MKLEMKNGLLTLKPLLINFVVGYRSFLMQRLQLIKT